MSAFKTIQTKMNKIDCLIEAMGKVKEKWKDKMEVDPSGKIHLKGYQGDDRANLPKSNKNYAPPCIVRVPKTLVGGAANDIGVSVGSDGNFIFHISEYDKSQGYNDKFMSEITQMYGLVEGVKDGIKVGATPVSDLTPLQGVPNMTGKKILGVRMAIPRSKAMQMIG